MKTRNKIIIGILFLSFIFIASAIAGYFIFKNNNNVTDFAVTDECVEEEIYEAEANNKDIEASSTEEKISPKAILIIKKKYNECGHTTEEDVELPTEIVNKTQEEIEEIYKDFEIEAFSSNEIVLYKEEQGKCNEHYKIKEEDGVIVIYCTTEGKEILYDKTGISTEYLTQEDLNKIRSGLEIYGKQNLNSFIEDFE